MMEVEIELVKRDGANQSPAVARLEEVIRQVVDEHRLHIEPKLFQPQYRCRGVHTGAAVESI